MFVRNQILIALSLFCLSLITKGQTEVIRVHFLYGSRPAHSFRHEEGEWFGGKLGGHVGIEYRDGMIIDFVPSGEFHVFPNENSFHSRFVSHSPESFYSLFGGELDSMKRAVVEIPVNREQKEILDSIVTAYYNQTPYDYAFFGMRCGAAGYEILSKLGIVRPWHEKKIARRIFYPRRFRKRIFDLALANGWKIEINRGTQRRIWERDKFRHRRLG